MKLLLGSFASSNTALPASSVLSSHLPPLAISESGCDIDCSLLLVADQLVYDRGSIARLKDLSHPSIARVIESVKVLESEGFVQLVDVQGLVEQHRALRDRAAGLATRDFSVWIPSLHYQIRRLDQLVPALRATFEDTLTEWDVHAFGIASFLTKEAGRVTRNEALNLKRLALGTNQRRRYAEDNAKLRAIVEATVSNIYSNILAAEAFDAVPYSWDTLSSFYDTALVLAAKNAVPEYQALSTCRQFFSLGFRECEPRGAREWIKLLKHRKLADLRKRILVAVQGEENIDAEFARRALGEIDASRQRLATFKQYSGRIAASASLVGGTVGGILGGLVGGIAGSAVPVLAQETADAIAERRIMSTHGWMYFTSSERANNGSQPTAPQSRKRRG
jgi:hypothetical protein